MSLALLLTKSGNPSFSFEHGTNHQAIYSALETLPNFVPAQTPIEAFWFDPRGVSEGQPASYWQLKHQFQHDYVAHQLTGGQFAFGANTDQNMVETNLNKPGGALAWTLFVNLHLHLAAMLATAPAF